MLLARASHRIFCFLLWFPHVLVFRAAQRARNSMLSVSRHHHVCALSFYPLSCTRAHTHQHLHVHTHNFFPSFFLPLPRNSFFCLHPSLLLAFAATSSSCQVGQSNALKASWLGPKNKLVGRTCAIRDKYRNHKTQLKETSDKIK